MPLFDEIARKREALLEIAARHGASNLRLFGSVLRGEERPDSDVDILIDIEEDRGFDSYLALAEELETLLGRRIDLITERSLSPFFRPFIEAEARPL
ncbi:MAG: nucleotidyltransferase family protein [Beijerinckiaceae bacterium]